MKKKLTTMTAAEKGVKTFKIPSFESWLKDYKLHQADVNTQSFFNHTSKLGDYSLQIGIIGGYCNSNIQKVGIGIACNAEYVFNMYVRKMFSAFEDVDLSTAEGIKKFKKWYEAKTAEANKTFANYMQENYFVGEKQQDNEMDNQR